MKADIKYSCCMLERKERKVIILFKQSLCAAVYKAGAPKVRFGLILFL